MSSDCFEWALTEHIDSAIGLPIFDHPSVTVSTGGVNLSSDCFEWALTEHIDSAIGLPILDHPSITVSNGEVNLRSKLA